MVDGRTWSKLVQTSKTASVTTTALQAKDGAGKYILPHTVGSGKLSKKPNLGYMVWYKMANGNVAAGRADRAGHTIPVQKLARKVDCKEQIKTR